jgi:lysophospholipase
LWQKYLENVKLENFNIDDFLKSAKQSGGVAALTLPNIGLALSGGGMRALCFSGSILDSFDSRNQKANEAKVGGILQLANYAVGVSG